MSRKMYSRNLSALAFAADFPPAAPLAGEVLEISGQPHIVFVGQILGVEDKR